MSARYTHAIMRASVEDREVMLGDDADAALRVARAVGGRLRELNAFRNRHGQRSVVVGVVDLLDGEVEYTQRSREAKP